VKKGHNLKGQDIWKQLNCQAKALLQRLPAFRHDGQETVTISGRRYRQGIIVAAIAVVLLVTGSAVGVYEYTQVQNLREKEALHEQQLQIMKDKTVSLQEKMDKLDALDQELRQMVKGAGTGESPKGDGSIAGSQKKSPDLSNADLNDLLHAASRLETKVNARVISFVTLKTVLSDTAGDQVREMQQISKKYESSTYPSIWPVKGPITSNFGYRGNPIGGGTGFHEGLDIAVDYGTPVRATASGTVSLNGWVDGYGNLVEINHGGGFVTRYGHNSLILVTNGQKVNTGDIIALAGSTGRSTGPHVHYEVRVNGTPTDPLLFLP
jgi:murein DD-endopeptidase MepM/ murein hydrolase activator NlpD